VIFVQSQVSNVSTISGREQITFQQQQQTKQNKHKIPPIKLKRHKIKNIQNNNKFWSGLTRPWLELINHQTRGEIASAFHTRGGGFSSN
jgi:hypothetical protein